MVNTFSILCQEVTLCMESQKTLSTHETMDLELFEALLKEHLLADNAVKEVDFARALVARDLLFAEGDQGVLVEQTSIDAGFELDGSSDLLTPLFVRYAEYCNVSYKLMLQRPVLTSEHSNLIAKASLSMPFMM